MYIAEPFPAKEGNMQVHKIPNYGYIDSIVQVNEKRGLPILKILVV